MPGNPPVQVVAADKGKLKKVNVAVVTTLVAVQGTLTCPSPSWASQDIASAYGRIVLDEVPTVERRKWM